MQCTSDVTDQKKEKAVNEEGQLVLLFKVLKS